MMMGMKMKMGMMAPMAPMARRWPTEWHPVGHVRPTGWSSYCGHDSNPMIPIIVRPPSWLINGRYELMGQKLANDELEEKKKKKKQDEEIGIFDGGGCRRIG